MRTRTCSRVPSVAASGAWAIARATTASSAQRRPSAAACGRSRRDGGPCLAQRPTPPRAQRALAAAMTRSSGGGNGTPRRSAVLADYPINFDPVAHVAIDAETPCHQRKSVNYPALGQGPIFPIWRTRQRYGALEDFIHRQAASEEGAAWTTALR